MTIAHRFLISMLALLIASTAQGQTVCKASDDLGANLVQQISEMLTPSDSLRISLNVPVVPASDVVLSADEPTCTRALQAQDSVIAASNASYTAPYPSRQLYVVKVGTYYASLDSRPSGEWKLVYFWDDQWRFLGFFLY